MGTASVDRCHRLPYIRSCGMLPSQQCCHPCRFLQAGFSFQVLAALHCNPRLQTIGGVEAPDAKMPRQRTYSAGTRTWHALAGAAGSPRPTSRKLPNADLRQRAAFPAAPVHCPHRPHSDGLAAPVSPEHAEHVRCHPRQLAVRPQGESGLAGAVAVLSGLGCAGLRSTRQPVWSAWTSQTLQTRRPATSCLQWTHDCRRRAPAAQEAGVLHTLMAKP